MQKNVANQRVVFSLFSSGSRVANPTIAAGDFKVILTDIGGALGAQNNVAVLPTTDAAGAVLWQPSQAETDADYVTFLANDQAGGEWEPVTFTFVTTEAVSLVIADAVLSRDFSAVTGAAARSLLNAVRFLRNRWAIAAGILTVYEEDDATPAWTGSVGTAASNPVDEIDPT